MSKLVCIRHGQSQWNKENRFTGWVDVELSELGIKEAEEAGNILKNYKFDKIFTSALKRAIRTAEIIIEVAGFDSIEMISNSALNERHYGDLQGLNKAEIGEKVGAEQLHIWRRSFDVAPPNGESLKDTLDRVLPYYEKEIAPLIKEGKDILISAHGNSLRALTMHIEGVSKEEISDINIPTGKPYVYEFDESLNLLSKKYLGENV
ncbi:MAG: 2,3-bisphosphoglycerate-dependent phosphoglycerate mutase [Candidatus Kapaibacterium sp.]|nr:2,3-bisphosphoglycerate-dependent phosphoglycerate mutase [Ignavibacteriota bacterium]